MITLQDKMIIYGQTSKQFACYYYQTHQTQLMLKVEVSIIIETATNADNRSATVKNKICLPFAFNGIDFDVNIF